MSRSLGDRGRFDSTILTGGRVVEFWDGGDRDGTVVLYHPGTPSCRVLGVWGHQAALDAGVRLVCVSRPGYGGSTPLDTPSLLETGRLTAALAASLGASDYAVVGASGGGPYAAATAAVDPDRVRVVAVVAGTGPWTELAPVDVVTADDVTVDEYRIVTRFAAGLTDADEYREFAEREFGELRRLAAQKRVDAFMSAFESPLLAEDLYRTIWAENLATVVAGLEGYVLDNLAWGARWDVDLADVVAATLLWYGDADESCPPSHGKWYADRIPGARLRVFPGARHIDMVDGHWPPLLQAIAEAWS